MRAQRYLPLPPEIRRFHDKENAPCSAFPSFFLCNALLFLAILNGRFRMVTSLIVSGAAYVLSLLLNLFLSPAFNDATGQIGNGINVFLLLVAAIFSIRTTSCRSSLSRFS